MCMSRRLTALLLVVCAVALVCGLTGGSGCPSHGTSCVATGVALIGSYLPRVAVMIAIYGGMPGERQLLEAWMELGLPLEEMRAHRATAATWLRLAVSCQVSGRSTWSARMTKKACR